MLCWFDVSTSCWPAVSIWDITGHREKGQGSCGSYWKPTYPAISKAFSDGWIGFSLSLWPHQSWLFWCWWAKIDSWQCWCCGCLSCSCCVLVSLVICQFFQWLSIRSPPVSHLPACPWRCKVVFCLLGLWCYPWYDPETTFRKCFHCLKSCFTSFV